jgi:hypothetical protein
MGFWGGLPTFRHASCQPALSFDAVASKESADDVYASACKYWLDAEFFEKSN